MPTFVLNDQSNINSHGFRLLNSGGDLTRFNQNPVMLFAHDMRCIIGKWNNLRIEGEQLKADPEFDEEDELGNKCKRQVDKEYLKGASPGIIVKKVEYSLEPNKEDEMVVTEWELCEASLVGVPSNSQALKLYNDKMEPISDDSVLLSLQGMAANNQNKYTMAKEVITLLTAVAMTALGLQEGATPEDISNSVMSLSARLAAEKVKREEVEAKLSAIADKQAEQLVNDAIKLGKITADKKESFLKLAKQDFDLAKETIDSIPAKQSLSTKVTNTSSGGGTVEFEKLSWDELDRKGLLLKFRTQNPEAFNQKFKEKFGKDYE